jgi:hypothetical protein
MHARIRLSPPAERSAGWSRYAEHKGCAARGMPGAADVAARMRDDGRDEVRNWRRLLDRYLEGWAEANPVKIFEATAHGYRFDDPFVGRFSRWSIAAYFERVRARFARAGAFEERDFAFSIQGWTALRAPADVLREAPRRASTTITVGEHGAPQPCCHQPCSGRARGGLKPDYARICMRHRHRNTRPDFEGVWSARASDIPAETGRRPSDCRATPSGADSTEARRVVRCKINLLPTA